VAGSGSSDLYAAAQEFLVGCWNALADTPDGSPSCYYISPGPPAWDMCPCLIVHASGPQQADTFPLVPALAPGHRPNVQGLVNLVTLTATILRCIPTVGENGELPDPTDVEAAAQQTYADLWAVHNHIVRGKRNGTIFPPDTREMLVDPAVSVVTQGGCGGWQYTIRVQLDGYVPGP